MPRKFCALNRSSHPEVLLGKGVLKICGQFTGEHPSWNAISIKLLCNFIKITLRHGFSPVNLLYIFTTLFIKNTSRWLLLLKVSIERVSQVRTCLRFLILLKFKANLSVLLKKYLCWKRNDWKYKWHKWNRVCFSCRSPEQLLFLRFPI